MKKIKGLTSIEVKQRISEGKVNVAYKPKVKSNFEIILSHIFNLFNAYNFIIAVALIAVKAYSSLFQISLFVLVRKYNLKTWLLN